MSDDALDQKVQALADQRRITAENLRNMSTPTSMPLENVLWEVSPDISSIEPVSEAIPVLRDIPLYCWNLTTTRVAEYLKGHPEESDYFL